MKINVDLIWPIGSIYISVNSTNPSLLFGGTWELVPGRFLLGTGEPGNNNYDGFGQLSGDEPYWSINPGITGGEYRHQLTINEMPNHRHDTMVDVPGVPTTARLYGFNLVQRELQYVDNYVVQATGGNVKHNNMPPFLCVYMWKRTA